MGHYWAYQWLNMLEQQAPPARYLDICASLHWWLLMLLSTYALGRHVRTRYSISRPHDIILWLSIDFSTIISSWFLDYAIPYFPFLLYLVMFVSRPSDVVPHPSATSEVSYFIYMILCPISYWLCTCSYHIYRWIYQDIVPHLSATSELSYLQILLCLFCVSITQ